MAAQVRKGQGDVTLTREEFEGRLRERSTTLRSGASTGRFPHLEAASDPRPK